MTGMSSAAPQTDDEARVDLTCHKWPDAVRFIPYWGVERRYMAGTGGSAASPDGACEAELRLSGHRGRRKRSNERGSGFG